MRIWDIDPGFLDRQRLLGEHRELHGLYNVITQGKKGYSRHPETLRWVGHVDALILRHEFLVEEMRLRGYNHQSPLGPVEKQKKVAWPEKYINTPFEQYELVKAKQTSDSGRILIPNNNQLLWAHHKYSILARDPEQYRRIGREVAFDALSFNELAEVLVDAMRIPPSSGRLLNALQHMYGYLKTNHSTGTSRESVSPEALLESIRSGVTKEGIEYLENSTALGELGIWLRI